MNSEYIGVIGMSKRAKTMKKGKDVRYFDVFGNEHHLFISGCMKFVWNDRTSRYELTEGRLL